MTEIEALTNQNWRREDAQPIKKKKCINHVRKRLGTSLCNIVTDCMNKFLVTSPIPRYSNVFLSVSQDDKMAVKILRHRSSTIQIQICDIMTGKIPAENTKYISDSTTATAQLSVSSVADEATLTLWKY